MLICRKWALLLVLGMLLAAPSAGATEIVSKFGSEKPVSLRDFRPHLKDAEGYTEGWYHGVWMDDGGFIGVDFVISNLGIGDHKGGFKANYKDKSGREIKCKAKYDDDEWSWSKKGFALKFGKNKLEGDLQGLKLEVRCKKLTMDLEFKNEVAPLQPGSGVLRFGKDDGEYSMLFTSPRASVTGTIKVEGQERQVQGVGHAYRSYTSMYPHKQARRWFRFKAISNDVSVVMAEMQAVSTYAHATNGWVLVLDSSGRIAATARINFVFDGYIKDTKSEEGYAIPRRLRLVAVDGKTQVSGVLLMKEITKIKDPTADLDAIQKAVVRRFTKPKDYHVSCQYQFVIKSEKGSRTLKGEGTYHYVYVNP